MTFSIADVQHKNTPYRVHLCWVSRFIYYYAEYQYAECHYAECHDTECRYAECRGALRNTFFHFCKIFNSLKFSGFLDPLSRIPVSTAVKLVYAQLTLTRDKLVRFTVNTFFCMLVALKFRRVMTWHTLPSKIWLRWKIFSSETL
jgi:hypothetical protein